jgi:hypothetical protein
MFTHYAENKNITAFALSVLIIEDLILRMHTQGNPEGVR